MQFRRIVRKLRSPHAARGILYSNGKGEWRLERTVYRLAFSL
jgi:hypothetical protein